MTATRSATCETTARSCEMNSMASPNLVRSSPSRFENLRLDGDVERGRRLVGDQQLRTVDDGHGDHDALAHASGELMRIVAGARARVGDGDVVHGIDGALPGFLLRDGMVGQHGLGDLISDAHDGVERGHGLLKDHGDARAAQLAHGIVGESRADCALRSVFGEEDFS